MENTFGYRFMEMEITNDMIIVDVSTSYFTRITIISGLLNQKKNQKPAFVDAIV